MTSNIIEFIETHMSSHIDVTFEQRFQYPHNEYPCSGHFFGGVARVVGPIVAHSDQTGNWIGILIDEWEEWEIADDACPCGSSIARLRFISLRRIMFDDNERMTVTRATPYGAQFWAWNTHAMHDGESEKLSVTLIDPQNLPLW